MIKTAIAILCSLALLLGAGCSQNPTSAAQNTPVSTSGAGYPPVGTTTSGQGYPAPTTASASAATAYPVGAGIAINTSDGKSQGISISDLSNLTQATVGSATGPKVTDILKLANVSNFESLTFTGSNGSVTLTKDKVNDQLILSLANNTITLIQPDVPAAQWIKDITQIKIQ